MADAPTPPYVGKDQIIAALKATDLALNISDAFANSPFWDEDESTKIVIQDNDAIKSITTLLLVERIQTKHPFYHKSRDSIDSNIPTPLYSSTDIALFKGILEHGHLQTVTETVKIVDGNKRNKVYKRFKEMALKHVLDHPEEYRLGDADYLNGECRGGTGRDKTEVSDLYYDAANNIFEVLGQGEGAYREAIAKAQKSAAKIDLPPLLRDKVKEAIEKEGTNNFEEIADFLSKEYLPAMAEANEKMGYIPAAAQAKAVADLYSTIPLQSWDIETMRYTVEALREHPDYHQNKKEMAALGFDYTDSSGKPTETFNTLLSQFCQENSITKEEIQNLIKKSSELSCQNGFDPARALDMAHINAARLFNSLNENKEVTSNQKIAGIRTLVTSLEKGLAHYTTLYKELGYDPTTFKYKGKAASTEATQEEKPKLSMWGAVATFIGAVGAVIGLAPKKQEEGKEQQPEGWFRPVARWFAAAVVLLSGVEAAGRAFADKSIIIGPATALLKQKRDATLAAPTPQGVG